MTQKVSSKHKMNVSYILRGNQDSFSRMTFLDIAHDAAVCTTAYYTISRNVTENNADIYRRMSYILR